MWLHSPRDLELLAELQNMTQPKKILQLFVTKELVDMVVEETNQYARQCITRGMIQTTKKWMRSLVSTCSSGITSFPMLICSGRKMRPLAFLRKKVMPRDSFNKLCQYLHLNNNERAIPRDKPNHKLCKVWLFLDAVVKSFHKQYRLNKNLSVDEAMVALKDSIVWSKTFLQSQ